MNPKDLEAFAREAAKHMKTEKDQRDFTRMLTKVTVKTRLTGLQGADRKLDTRI